MWNKHWRYTKTYHDGLPSSDRDSPDCHTAWGSLPVSALHSRFDFFEADDVQGTILDSRNCNHRFGSSLDHIFHHPCRTSSCNGDHFGLTDRVAKSSWMARHPRWKLPRDSNSIGTRLGFSGEGALALTQIALFIANSALCSTKSILSTEDLNPF